MKRFALIAVGAMMMGCAQENKPAPAPTSDAGQAPAPTAAVSPAPAVSATPATPPAVAPTVTPAPAAPAAVPAEPTAPTVAVPPVPTPAPAAPKAKPVFELTQDNKVYVFATVDAMLAFNGGQAQPTVVEKPNFTAGGKTVVIEAADAAQAEEVLAGYLKLHPVAK